jgi:hypothetical protein
MDPGNVMICYVMLCYVKHRDNFTFTFTLPSRTGASLGCHVDDTLEILLEVMMRGASYFDNSQDIGFCSF